MNVKRLDNDQFKRLSGAIKEIFADQPGSIKIINDVHKQLNNIVKAKGAKQVDAQLASDLVSDAILRFAGVTVGGSKGLGQITGSPLMTAGFMSNYFRKVLGQQPIEKTFSMMEEMIINPAIYKEQLENILKTTDQAEVFIQSDRFLKTLAGTGAPSTGLSQETIEEEVTY